MTGTVKQRFEDKLPYQLTAIQSVVDLFRGQESNTTSFTLKQSTAQLPLSGAENDLGAGNRLELLDEEILANLRKVQIHNGLPPSSTLASFTRSKCPACSFSSTRRPSPRKTPKTPRNKAQRHRRRKIPD